MSKRAESRTIQAAARRTIDREARRRAVSCPGTSESKTSEPTRYEAKAEGRDRTVASGIRADVPHGAKHPDPGSEVHSGDPVP